MLFAEGVAIGCFYKDSVVSPFLERLPRGDRKADRMRAALAGVALEGKSNAQIARELQLSREHFVRSVARNALFLLYREQLLPLLKARKIA